LHTDEYEIALYKEVRVCESNVRMYQRQLNALDARSGPNTAVFGDQDAGERKEAAEALARWRTRKDEYERLLGIMKIAAC